MCSEQTLMKELAAVGPQPGLTTVMDPFCEKQAHDATPAVTPEHCCAPRVSEPVCVCVLCSFNAPPTCSLLPLYGSRIAAVARLAEGVGPLPHQRVQPLHHAASIACRKRHTILTDILDFCSHGQRLPAVRGWAVLVVNLSRDLQYVPAHAQQQAF